MSPDDDIASAATALGTGPQAPESATDAPASVIGDRYEVLALLGAGGMGRVYRAHDRTLDELVALKLLRRELLALPGMLERFRQEVKLARRVTHANVVRTFDLGQHGEDHYLTMELVDGRSLARLLDEGLLPLPEMLRIARAAAAGIAAAHAADVLHRDLKPDNVLVARSGRVAITDFGIAQVAADPMRPSESFVGTPAYMAPEQVEGTLFGPPGDVYSFGAILFEMATGTRPFGGRDAFAVAHARLTKPAPDPREFCAMPDALADVIKVCLARDPAKRFADGAALGTALAALTLERAPARLAPLQAAVPNRTSKSVALLPLRASGELGEIAEGLTEEIIDALSLTRELRVRPLATVRASASATGADATPDMIGRALGVDVVVDGSVRRRGEQIRIAARAIGAIDGFQLWASHLDTAPSGLLAAGDEVARAIARALTVELEMPDRVAGDSRAMELYLESKARLRLGWNYGRIESALAGLEQAHEIAPGDPAIMAALSMALSRTAFYGIANTLDRARALAWRAVELAPASGDAHVAVGLSSLYTSRVPEAGRAFARAVSFAPGLPLAQALFGAILLEADAVTGAYDHLRAAYEIDPATPAAADLARALVYLGREDELQAHVQKLGSTPIEARMGLARYAMWRGETYDVQLSREERGALQDYTRYFEVVERVHRTRTFPEAEREQFRHAILVLNPRLRSTRSQFMAEYMMFVGEPELALEFITHAVDAGLQDHCWMQRCPLLVPLHGRPEFQSLAATVATRARDVLAAVSEVLQLPT